MLSLNFIQNGVLTKIIPSQSKGYWITKSNHNNNKQVSSESQTKSRFKSKDKAESFLRLFEPFLVHRSLGSASELKLETYGLSTPFESKLWIESSKQNYQFAIGNKSYNKQYALDINQNKLILIPSKLVEQLKQVKQHLADYNIFQIKLKQINRVKFIKNNHNWLWTASVDPKSKLAIWHYEGMSKAQGKQFRLWLSKFMRLKYKKYLDSSQEESLLKTAPFITVELFNTNSKLEEIKLFVEGDGSTQAKYYLKSNWTEGLVEASQSSMSNYVAGLSKLLGL